MTDRDPPAEPDPDDPILRRRETIRRVVGIANRLGYLLLTVAVIVFFVALATGFSSAKAGIVAGTFIASCVLLAPTIVLGYAVKAADRDDRARGL